MFIFINTIYVSIDDAPCFKILHCTSCKGYKKNQYEKQEIKSTGLPICHKKKKQKNVNRKLLEPATKIHVFFLIGSKIAHNSKYFPAILGHK